MSAISIRKDLTLSNLKLVEGKPFSLHDLASQAIREAMEAKMCLLVIHTAISDVDGMDGDITYLSPEACLTKVYKQYDQGGYGTVQVGTKHNCPQAIKIEWYNGYRDSSEAWTIYGLDMAKIDELLVKYPEIEDLREEE